MEARRCRRCDRQFVWDSGPVEQVNQCPRCSGVILPADELAGWMCRACLVIGCVATAWAIMGLLKLIFGGG